MRPTPEESDAARDHFAGLGAGVLMEGRIGETIQFYYLDTEPLLKVIFESGTGHAVDLKPSRIYPET
jgi:methylmalonyl-CoA/ethylmalonyl-CoA epimerase